MINTKRKDNADYLLIAPCGMNCGICIAHLRSKNICPGCRTKDSSKPRTRSECSLSNCTVLSATGSYFCYDCGEYPCKRLKHLDKRYRTKYHMSMIENLDTIKNIGLADFLKNEKVRWRCPECGGVICVHKAFCLTCEERLKSN